MNYFNVFAVVIMLVLYGCYACILVSLWMCYRRTGNRAFILLGAVLLLSPIFFFGINSLASVFIEEAAKGDRPWLFPFSLMGGPNPTMAVGEFVWAFMYVKDIVRIGLIAACLAVLAKSFTQPQAPATH